MKRVYINPQTQALQFISRSETMQTIGIVHHSGGTNTGGKSGFPEDEIM